MSGTTANKTRSLRQLLDLIGFRTLISFQNIKNYLIATYGFKYKNKMLIKREVNDKLPHFFAIV